MPVRRECPPPAMPTEVNQTEPFANAVGRVRQLCDFGGAAKVFWPSYLAVLGGISGGAYVVLLRAGPKESPGWKKVLAWPAENALADPLKQQFLALSGDVAEACVGQESARRRFSAEPPREDWCLGVRLAAAQESEVWVAVLCLCGANEGRAEEALRRVRLLAHLPAVYQLRQRSDRSETAVSHFASVLELVSRLNEGQRFLAVAMTFCNELAARHRCVRVSLGWLEGDYVRLKAMNHAENFERRMEAVQMLEDIMEEALDQDEIVVWPAPDDQDLVIRAHEKLGDEQKVKFLCSLPLRLDGEPVAVLSCERNTEPFTDVELRLLTLCGDLAVRRLADLRRHDRWFGARLALAAREQAARLLGPRHTGSKLLGVALAVALAFGVFGRMTYRVEAPFTLAVEDAAFLAAPFAGYIDEVNVEPGQAVKKGETLATLDSRDLLLEEAAALADEVRYQREAQKASAGDKIAEMRIAEAQAEQARARLELLRHRLWQSTHTAPFDSVVIEGDLKKRIGAPVKQGDVLMTVTRLDHMYVECQVREQDIAGLHAGGSGEVAFASLPKFHFPVRVERIEPVAEPKESGNVVVVRCLFQGVPKDWWRPGMRGVARLEVARRSPLWMLLHRTADFLRLNFWW